MTTSNSQHSDHVHNETRLKEISHVLKKHEIIKGISPVKLREILEDLGPTFVKIGQIMSMRADILPLAYCEELTKLRADVLPMKEEEVLSVLTEAYGKDPLSKFSNFDLNPLGSASMAQTHKAILKTGETVAIKVQRPNIREIMTEDIQLLKKAAKLLKIVHIGSDIIDFNMIIDEMWSVTNEELDFRYELKNGLKFYENLQGIKYVTSPKFFPELSDEHVLVEEFIDGVQIDNFKVLKEKGYDLNEIGVKLVNHFAKQVLEDGFFHADPHPGNILIKEGQIVWIDMGMMGTLKNHDRLIFKRAVTAVASKDIPELQDIILTIGDYKGQINHSKLFSDIDDLMVKYAGADLASINLGETMTAVLEVAKSHGIAMPKGMSMFARSVVTIEGVISSLAPEISVIDIMSIRMKESFLDNFSVKNEALEITKDFYFSVKKAIDLPGHLADFVKMLIRGQTKINMELSGSNSSLGRIEGMINRLILGILSAALLIGSSILCTANFDLGKFGIPTLGVIGFVLAGILGIWLIWGILKGKNK
ncbi:MAG: ABC1 kinase family protein [Eubacteriaceae bacterium]